MLRATGFADADFDRRQITLANSWNEVTPSNMPLGELAPAAQMETRQAAGVPVGFCTIDVSDVLAMGHEDLRASLGSRGLIADLVETLLHVLRFDEMVTVAGRDKSLSQ